MIGRMALRAVIIFLMFVGTIGGLVGIIVGIGYGIFTLSKHFGWGEAGVAIMTLLVVFAVVSVLIAWSEEYNHTNPGQES